MGLLTRSEIVTQGMYTAGRDDLTTLANTWLQNWLNSVAAAWDWQILRNEATVSLSAQQMDIGNGSGGISERILRVNDEMWWYTTDRNTRGRIELRDQNAGPRDRIQPTTTVGSPASVRILKPGIGVARLSFEPTPDKTYNLFVSYQHMGAQLTGDSSVPWYENDETMIQAVAYKTHEYVDGKDAPVTVAAQQMLSALVNNDKYRYGIAAGQNDTLYKDPKVFPRSRR
jgi:hypothetical protein